MSSSTKAIRLIAGDDVGRKCIDLVHHCGAVHSVPIIAIMSSMGLHSCNAPLDASSAKIEDDLVTAHMGASLAGLVDEYKQRRRLTETTLAEQLGMSRMNLNLWRREGLRALPTRERLEKVSKVTGTPYQVVLDTALAECGYLDSPPLPVDTVSLNDVVAMSRIVAGIVGRGLSPGESSQLRTAWVSTSPRTLAAVADRLDPPEGCMAMRDKISDGQQ